MTRAILLALLLSGCAAVRCEMEKQLMLDGVAAQRTVCVASLVDSQAEIARLRQKVDQLKAQVEELRPLSVPSGRTP